MHEYQYQYWVLVPLPGLCTVFVLQSNLWQSNNRTEFSFITTHYMNYIMCNIGIGEYCSLRKKVVSVQYVIGIYIIHTLEGKNYNDTYRY